MRVQDDGDLEVSPGEMVTVEIEAFQTAFLAHTGPLHIGQWLTVTRVSPTTEVRTFIVTQTFSSSFSFTIGFDFSPADGGKIPSTAKYVTRITGSGPGGAVRVRENRPTSILPATRSFSFEIGQG